MEIVVTQPKIGSQMVQEEKYFDYSSRAIYLRAIVLGGLKGVAYAAFTIMSPILMSVGVVAIEIKAILLTSFTGLAAGTLHLAITQYVFVPNMIYGHSKQKGTSEWAEKEWRSSAVMTLASLSLFLVGVIGAALGKAPVARSCARV
nr:vacuolar iron transporter like 1 [Quercus suber]